MNVISYLQRISGRDTDRGAESLAEILEIGGQFKREGGCL